MLFSPRIRLKPLAQLCHRLGVSVGAGIDDRRVWRDEAERGGRHERVAAAAIRDAVGRGDSITDALRLTSDYYPPLFHQIVAVGEKTGRLEGTYRRLGEHYDNLLAARRMLVGALSWPFIQLGMAVLVVAVLIWVTGAFNLTDINGQPLDMLGLGLRGTSGLATLMGVVVAAMLALMWVIEAGRRGAAGTRTLLAWATRIPLIGESLSTLAIAQFTWALQLVIDTPMDLRQALPLALDATGNDHYSRLGPQVARRVEQGATIQEALAETGAFPSDVLEAIAVGERTGMLAETMQRLARDYQERAAIALGVLAQAFGYFIWLLVGILLVVLIFRLFNIYMDPIRQLTDPNFKL